MNKTLLIQAICNCGISRTLAYQIIAKYEEFQRQPRVAPHAGTWTAILRPLRYEITHWYTYRTRNKWPTDPEGAQLWADYYALLRDTLRRLGTLGRGKTGLSLQEAVFVFQRDGRACGLSHWSEWVPEATREDFTLRFENYYASDPPSVQRTRKKIVDGRWRTVQAVPTVVPFTDATTRRKRAQGWEKLREQIMTDGRRLRDLLVRPEALTDPRRTAAITEQLQLMTTLRQRFKDIHADATASRRNMKYPPPNYWAWLTAQEREVMQRTNAIIDGKPPAPGEGPVRPEDRNRSPAQVLLELFDEDGPV